MEARRAPGSRPAGGGTTAARSPIARTILYLPLGCILFLAAWTVGVGTATGSFGGFLAGLVAAGLSAGLGVWGTLRPAEWADGGALLVTGGVFVGFGTFLPVVGLGALYLFVVLSLVTGHLLAFRRTVRPLLLPGTAPSERSLRPVYVHLLGRLGLLGALTFLLSALVIALAPAFVLPLATEVALFLLGLGTVLGLLAMSLLKD